MIRDGIVLLMSFIDRGHYTSKTQTLNIGIKELVLRNSLMELPHTEEQLSAKSILYLLSIKY